MAEFLLDIVQNKQLDKIHHRLFCCVFSSSYLSYFTTAVTLQLQHMKLENKHRYKIYMKQYLLM